MKRRTQTFVLFVHLCRTAPRCRVYLSGSSVDAAADMFVRAFPTQRQCEDFIRTVYHQRKTLAEVMR